MNIAMEIVVFCAGAYLLLVATMVNASGLLNSFLFRMLPVIIGAATIWASAVMFMANH